MAGSFSFNTTKLAICSADTSRGGLTRTCVTVSNARASTIPTAARHGKWSAGGVSQRGAGAGAGAGQTRRERSGALSTIKGRKSGVAGRGMLQVVSSSSDVFTIALSTEDARRTILLEQFVREDGTADVYCAGVGIDSQAGILGLAPGMVLRSLSDPIKKGEMWVLSDKEKLRFVKDAINTTRLYEFSLTFDKDPTITLDMLAAAKQELEAPEYVDGRVGSAAGPQKADRVDRPDLYSDQWEGDKFVGSGWNELTIGLAIAIGVPVIGLIFALSTRGTLWGVVSFY